MTGRRAISIIGFAFAVLALAVGVILAVLFLVPGSSFLGVTLVDRESYTTYAASQITDIDDLLNSRNIIIDSQNVDIEIRVRKPGQLDVGTIQVFEKQSGLTFNSIKRTYLEWMQVVTENEQGIGEVCYKLIVKEPNGAVARNTTVYINMYPNDISRAACNFILNTRKSNVRFASDDFTQENNFLLVDTITLDNASGRISFPEPKNESDFFVDVGSFVVNGGFANIAYKSDLRHGVTVNGYGARMQLGNVTEDVNVSSNACSISTGSVGGDLSVNGNNSVTTGTVSGDVTVNGNSSVTTGAVSCNAELNGNVSFYQKSGGISGNVVFKGDTGIIDIESCKSLNAEGNNVTVNITKKCDEIVVNAESGSLYVAQISDESRLLGGGNVPAEITVKYGSVDLREVWCDVDIDTNKGGTSVNVSFASAIDITGVNLPKCGITGYDGAVDISNICGETDILILAGGKGYVNADFRKVVGQSKIEYQRSTRPPDVSYAGRIKITFADDVYFCWLIVKNNASGYNYTDMLQGPAPDMTAVPNGGSLSNFESIYYVNNHNDPGGFIPELTVDTSNALSIHSRS